MIQFDSATVSSFVRSRAFFPLYSTVLSSACLFIVRGRGGENGTKKKKDRQWGHPQQISTNNVRCSFHASFVCLMNRAVSIIGRV